MKKIGTLLFAAIASLLLFVVIFAVVVKRPLTIGFIAEALALKDAYAQSIKGPKVVVIGGSSSLFGVRCEIMEPILGRGCVNGALTATLPLSYLLRTGKRWLQPGDTALLPLEYGHYVADSEHPTSTLAGMLLNHDRSGLLFYSPAETLRILTQLNFQNAISGLVEMGLKAAGIERRFNISVLTHQGDMKDHTKKKSRAYRSYIQSIQTDYNYPDLRNKAPNPALPAFLAWATKNRITVVGTYPTTFSDVTIPKYATDLISGYFQRAGHRFLSTPSNNQYDRSCFYDGLYHLNEDCQIRHSKMLAESLAPLLAANHEGRP